jgi:amino acid adenylation domain-containing protein
VQVIRPAGRVALPVMDLSGLPESDREPEAHRLAAQEADRPFDLGRDALLRATLLRLGERDHVLLLTMHHVVSDAWSLGILVREMVLLYEAYRRGEPSPLADPPIQYADFACWQRRWLRGEALARLIDYWKRQLAGIPPVLDLPADRPRPSIQSYRGASHAFAISADAARAVKALCRQESATLFMALLAVFDSLLHRYTGQTDLVVGTPIANRTHAQIEGLIGFFSNTLALRADLSGDPSFSELLRRTRETVLEAHAHQDLPFERLVEELQPERSLSHHPIFQVMLTLQNTPSPAVELHDLVVRPMDSTVTTSKFDLLLSFQESEGGIEGAITYATDRFDRPAIERMARHFATLLEDAAARPKERVSRLPLLPACERDEILVGWNETRSDGAAAAGGVHALIEAQVDRTPEAVAVVFGDRHLTYRDLERRANRLSWKLRAVGVGPDDRVGLCLERSPDLMVAILAVLKAGGAYVPIDPSYPPERRRFIFDDARASAVVTERDLAEGLDAFPDSRPPSVVSAENLAYVLYTSGSTGRPKGVAMRHGALANLIAWQARAGTAPESACTLQFASASFDVSFQEIAATWASGGTLVLVLEAERRDASVLLRVIEERRIERLFLPFVALEHLADVADREGKVLSSLREVITAGEALRITPAIARFFARLPAVVLHNQYGPTEAHVVTQHTLTGPAEGWPALPPIGRPIANTRAYVLDRHGEPVPIGVPGELYLGGAGLARGYLHRPALTAERFLPDPFSPEPGSRLYRTGDLVRFREDGSLDFLGRLDHQTKIRGVRIEPGEIEARLREHPAVSDTTVIARDESPSLRRLVAYVVSRRSPPPTAGELRRHLEKTLPDHLLPAAIVFLDALPLTPSGKLDRRALPAPAGERPSLDRAYVAPRTPQEEVMAGIWAGVLGVERVGVHDDFFELGGHSLLATQVISRVREAFRVEVALRRVFESPTVSGLVEEVEAARRQECREEMPPLERVSREGEPPLSFAQQRLWFIDQLEPGSPAYNISLGVRFEGSLDVASLKRAISEVVRRHEALRTTFEAVDGRAVQVIHAAQTLALPVVDLSALPVAEREARVLELAGEDAARPFDLTRGPLLRATLLRLSKREHVLLASMHHIASDGWSMGVFSREVGALYEAFRRGEPSPLREPAVQYADYACWQRRWLEGRLLERQLDYWKRALAGAPPVLELPADRPRPPVQTYRGGFHAVALEKPHVDALRSVAQRERATLFMALLATFECLLHRCTGETDLVVGTPIANRTRSEIEGMIGFFVNTLALRTDLSGRPSFRELVRRVRESALGAYAHQDLPFEKLVEEIQPVRALSHPPVFQVMFIHQNAAVPKLSLGEVAVSPVETGITAAKFDLTLSLEETEDGIAGAFLYNADLFEAPTVARLSEHWRSLVERIAANPDRSVDDLPLLAEEETRALLEDWGCGPALEPPDACLHSLFESQVDRTPDAPAVEFEEGVWTYRRLDLEADGLACWLADRGVGPESRVGVSMERCPEMVVAVLGILKAGGAYVPIDPGGPPERARFIREDSRLALVLGRQQIAEAVAAKTPSRASRPQGGVGPRNAAYVIYTSGSTGRPKGVVVEHRSAAAYLRAFDVAIPRAARCRLPVVTALGFDASLKQVLGPLLQGGCVWIVPDAVVSEPADLWRVISRRRGVALNLVPSLWEGVLEAIQAEGRKDATALELLLLGGEAAGADLVRRTFEALPHLDVWNLYGPTEATVNACAARLAAGDRVTIGRPIAGASVMVLDAAGRPAPIGVPGEVFIGGVGVARGYLDRPALTAERFVPDPFSSEAGARLYRTGDRARWLTDGRLEWLGRTDEQVKIRGQRIELGEVAAVIREHPGVREAAVAVREDRPGDRRLVAYVIPAGGETVGDEGLRRFLSERLPPACVPSAFVSLRELPRTASGKLDRRALPAPAAGAGGLAQPVPPRDVLEVEILRLFEETLGVCGLGVREDFFALGGHSLLAVRLVARIRRQLGVALSLALVFRAPTVEGLAAALRRGGTLPASPLVAIRTSGSRPPLFCVHPAGGSAHGFATLARHLDPEQPVYGLQAAGFAGERAAAARIEVMAAEYLQATRTVAPCGPVHLCGWSLGGLIAFEMALQREQRGEEVAGLVLLDSVAPSPGAILDEAALLRGFLRFHRAPIEPDSLLGLEPIARWRMLLGRLVEADLVPPEIGPEEIARLFEVYRANVRAAAAYAPSAYGGSLTVLRASDRPPEEASHPLVRDPQMGWGRFVRGPIDVQAIPGSHETILSPPHVRSVAEAVQRWLDAVTCGKE